MYIFIKRFNQQFIYDMYILNVLRARPNLKIQEEPQSLVTNTHKNIRQCERLSKVWRGIVVVITTAQFHSTKPELRFCAGSNPAGGVSEIHDGKDL